MNAAEQLYCLLVDDREENLFAHEELLRDTGARIIKARSGDEALDLLLRHEFAIALLDVQMPGMDGIELAETMRSIKRTRSVPIIFLTAATHDESKIARAYLAGGAVDFLCKPVSPAVVRSKVGVFLEIARRRRALNANLASAELALAQAEDARRRMVEAHALRDHLLTIVAHDLRTPLSAVMLTANLLERGYPDLHDPVRCILRCAARMRGIIEGSINASRAQQGRFELVRVETDAVDVCREVIAETRVVHPTCTIELDGDASVEGWWDRRLLGQVCSNLVGNAVVHGDNAPVTVTVSADDRHANIEVHNGGAPIPESVLPHVFDPYRRGRVKPASTGLGLGLFIAREIVQAHDGEITTRSTRGEGTRFTVRLPLDRP
jgi:signal transduction histidine kinase